MERDEGPDNRVRLLSPGGYGGVGGRAVGVLREPPSIDRLLLASSQMLVNFLFLPNFTLQRAQ